jgi:subtilisin family serine protease
LNWKATIADAVDFIFSKAAEFGKPAVINASLGDYYGSHDGKDAAALFIDDLLETQPGRAMVAAAGNSNNFAPYHLAYDVPETDTAFTWFSYNPNSVLGEPAVFFELWADSADFFDTGFTIGADLTTPEYEFKGYADWRTAEENLGQSLIDTLFLNDEILGIVETWCGQRGEQYQVQIAVTEAFSNQYKWRFATTGGGTFDVWSYGPFGTSVIESANLPSAAVYPPMANYRLPDKLKTIVDSWTCSDKVLTVANYVNRNEYTNVLGETTVLEDFEPQNISVNSSSGPTRDNRQKPDITATGDIILSAGQLEMLDFLTTNQPDRVAEGGWHYRNGGTSMASPAVAGVAALYFERDPQATYADVKTAIKENALADQYTGVLPNLRWGYGKLDAFATLTEPFGVTSAAFVDGENGLYVYPNPAREFFIIPIDRASVTEVRVFDLSGRVVRAFNPQGVSGSSIEIITSDLPAGIYLISVRFEDGSVGQAKLAVED